MLSGLIIGCFYLQPVIAEDITITTYYPSPFGSYDELTANEMKIGSNYSRPLASGGANFEPSGLLVEGRVCIGTPTPNAAVKLDITGTENFGIRYLKTGSRDARIAVGDPTKTWSWATGWATAGDFSLIEETVAGNRIYVKQGTGNVGIGTSNPLSKLVVTGSSTTNTTSALNVTRSDGNSSLFVRDDGKVGIGTTTPVATLDVGVPGGQGNLHVAGHGNPPTPVQGAYLGWNVTGGTGETDFINQSGLGPGGFHFIESTSGGVRTTRMTLSGDGRYLTFPGGWNVITNGGVLHVASSNNQALHLNPWAGAGPVVINGGGGNSSLLINNGGQLYVAGRIQADYPRLDFSPNPNVWSWFRTGGTTDTYCSIGFRPWIKQVHINDSWHLYARTITNSSIKWKEHIKPINNALNKVLALRGVSFDWKKDHGGKHALGMIAEEAAKVIPEAVIIDKDPAGYSTGIDYTSVTAILIEAIKEQQKQIESLKEQIKELKTKIK